MSDEMQIVPNTEIATSHPAHTLSQVGDKNVQVAHADNVVANTNNIFLVNGGANAVGAQEEAISQFKNYLATKSTEFYNLFVINGETFDNGRFFVPPTRALTDDIDPALRQELAELSDDAITRIKTFPSLFMGETDWANPDQIAHYGFVTGVTVQKNAIRITFQKLNPLPQHRLNDMLRELGIRGWSKMNEFTHTHWTVKHVNLLDELRIAGLPVFGI